MKGKIITILLITMILTMSMVFGVTDNHGLTLVNEVGTSQGNGVGWIATDDIRIDGIYVTLSPFSPSEVATTVRLYNVTGNTDSEAGRLVGTASINSSGYADFSSFNYTFRNGESFYVLADFDGAGYFRTRSTISVTDWSYIGENTNLVRACNSATTPACIGNGVFSMNFSNDPIYDGYIYNIQGIETTDVTFIPPNSEPVINSISPSERIELRNGETQLYTLNVTDTDGDASYSWILDGTEVSTSSTYTADYDNIEAGIYTLTAYVSDAEFNNSISTTLEIRAKGGDPTNIITAQVIEDVEDDIQTTTNTTSNQTNIFQKFWNWLRGLF